MFHGGPVQKSSAFPLLCVYLACVIAGGWVLLPSHGGICNDCSVGSCSTREIKGKELSATAHQFDLSV